MLHGRSKAPGVRPGSCKEMAKGDRSRPGGLWEGGSASAEVTDGSASLMLRCVPRGQHLEA